MRRQPLKKRKAVNLQVRVQVAVQVRGRVLEDQVTEDLVGEDSQGRGHLDLDSRQLGVPFLSVPVKPVVGLMEEYVIRP